VSNEFPPHEILGKDNKWQGVAIDVFRLLAIKSKCQVKIVNVPWDRTVDSLSRGKIDALSMFTFSEERAKFSYFIGPHYKEAIVLVVSKVLHESIEQPQDLMTFQGLIGKTQGSYYGEELNGLLKSKEVASRLVNIVSNQRSIEMLKMGRLDAVIEELSVVNYLFNTGVLDKNEYMVKLKFSLNPVYFGFSKKSVTPDRLKTLQTSWLELRDSEQVRQIYQKYHLDFSPSMLIEH
jgi:polar amino acid transport system substrate-binding protein